MKLFLTIMLCVVVTMSTEGEERVIEDQNVPDARWTSNLEEDPDLETMITLTTLDGEASVALKKKYARQLGHMVKEIVDNTDADEEAYLPSEITGAQLKWFAATAITHVDSYENTWSECFEKPMPPGGLNFAAKAGCPELKARIVEEVKEDPEKMKDMVVAASFLGYDDMVQAFSGALANHIRGVMKP